MQNDNMILQLQTFPASLAGLKGYRKELIKVGHYIHPSTGQKFEVTSGTLEHWVKTFVDYLSKGNKVPIPLGHERDNQPELNAGWVTSMFIEGKSLYGILELVNPELALTTDVSICIEAEVTDGKGHKYESVITHVALTTHPVVVGLEGFKKLSLSLSVKETNMEFLKSIAEKLGLSKDATEDDVSKAVDVKLAVDNIEVEITAVDPLVKLISENRAMKLSNLVKGGLITAAVKDVITNKYVKVDVLALSMENKVEDGFDLLYDVLVQNRPVNLEEITGVQSLELSNQQVKKPNAMQEVVSRKRKEAGLDK